MNDGLRRGVDPGTPKAQAGLFDSRAGRTAKARYPRSGWVYQIRTR